MSAGAGAGRTAPAARFHDQSVPLQPPSLSAATARRATTFADPADSFACVSRAGVRDEFKERTVRLAEIQAHPDAACPASFHRPQLHWNAVLRQVRLRRGDRSPPDEAQIAATRWNRYACDRVRLDTRSVHVQLQLTETIYPAFANRHNLHSEHVTIELVGALPVRDVNHAVIERQMRRRVGRRGHLTAPKVRPRTRNRWITQVNATIGAIIVTTAAQIAPIWSPCDDISPASATGSVFELRPVNTRAKRNSFQERTKAKTPAASIPGSESGTMMRQKAPRRPLPSTNAASSNSRGIPWKKPIRIQTTNGRLNER